MTRRGFTFQRNSVWCLMASGFLIASCVDRIPFQAKEADKQVVIFGTFSQLDEDQYVTLAYTSAFGELGQPIDGAVVTVLNQNEERGNYQEMQPGKYVLPKGVFPGVPGDVYRLEVTLQNGENFISDEQQMPLPIVMDQVQFVVSESFEVSPYGILLRKPFIEVRIETDLTDDLGNRGFIRWQTEEVFSFVDLNCGAFDIAEQCYFLVDQDFSAVTIFNAINDNQSTLENFKIFSREPFPGVEFEYRHYFNVRQHVMSAEAYEFWRKVDIVTSPQGSIFDQIPAGVYGNIRRVDDQNPILGFFEVVGVSEDRVFTTPDNLRGQVQIIPSCNPFIPAFFQPPSCCTCLSLPYDPIPRPDYW